MVQVYLGVPASGQPPKRLVAFEKIELAPGAVAELNIEIDSTASHHPLSIYNVATQAFERVTGEFTVFVGRSSSAADLSHMTVNVQ